MLLAGAAAVAAGFLPFAAAQSVKEGRTTQDRRFIIGGVGLDESERMKALAGEFALTVLVAAQSGAYLADTRVSIADAQGATVLDTQLTSPYLLVDLAAGRYDVQATYQGMTQRRRVTVADNARAKIAFTFPVPVDQSAKSTPSS
jgi:hypothetical protein